MRLVALLAAGADLALALAVFALLARPALGVGPLARAAGRGEAWREGRLGAEEEEAFLRIAGRAGAFGLALLLAWSFVTGALLALSRLPAPR